MLIHTSALVAILSSELDAPALAARLEAAQEPFTTCLIVAETVMALQGMWRISTSEALFVVNLLIERADIEVVGIGPDQYVSALKAYERYGKGSDSPANLNMSDCFAHAMAQKRGVPLLYKGNNFSFTDLR